MPPAFTVDRLIPSMHDSDGGFATGGGGGGGGGVGAVGGLLHPAAIATMMTADANPERIAQYFTDFMNG